MRQQSCWLPLWIILDLEEQSNMGVSDTAEIESIVYLISK
jgi:hypothetical protein